MPDAVTHLAWSLEGSSLAAGCLTGEVLILRYDGAVKHRLCAGSQAVSSLAWSSDGYWLGTGSRDGTLTMLGPGGIVERLELGCWIQSAAWAPDRSILAAAAGNNVYVLDTGGHRLAGYLLHPGRVNHLCWDPTSSDLLAATVGGIRFYDVALASTDPVGLAPSSGTILTIAPSPQADLVAAGRSNGSVIVWRTEGGGATVLTGSKGGVSLLSWSADGDRLAVAAFDELTVWRCVHRDFDTEGRINLPVPPGAPGSIAYHPSLPILAWGGEQGRIGLWAPALSTEQLAGYRLTGDVTALCWHPNGRALAAATSVGEIEMLEVAENPLNLGLTGAKRLSGH
ncbi:MAG: hypothetical protein WD602_07520 [Actinomycetota bacterium]